MWPSSHEILLARGPSGVKKVSWKNLAEGPGDGNMLENLGLRPGCGNDVAMGAQSS